MGLDLHDGRNSCRSRESVAECDVGKVCRVNAGKCLFGHPKGLQRAVDDEPVVTGLCAEPSVPVDPVRVCGESREGDQGELVHVDAVRSRSLEGGFDEVLGRSGPIRRCGTRCGTRSRGWRPIRWCRIRRSFRSHGQGPSRGGVSGRRRGGAVGRAAHEDVVGLVNQNRGPA